MATSEARIEANRRNSLLSTGPRTDAGKAVTRGNAVKHGMRASALVVGRGETSPEVESERALWVQSFGPKNIVTERLADVAFRSHRLWKHVADTEEALVAARTRRAARRFETRQARRIEEARHRLFEKPAESLATFRGSVSGFEKWLETIDDFEVMVRNGDWSPAYLRVLAVLTETPIGSDEEAASWSDELLALAGLEKRLRDPHLGLQAPPEIVHFEAKFEAHTKDPARNPLPTRDESEAFEEAKREWNEALNEIRPQFERDVKSLRNTALEARESICARLYEAREQVVAELEEFEASGEDEMRLRIAIERVKVDTSDKGRLRHRYLTDALRDLLKALKAAQDACGVNLAEVETAPEIETPIEPEPEPEPKPEIATEVETAEISEVAATPSAPNEPNGPQAEEAGFAESDESESISFTLEVDPPTPEMRV